VFAEILLCNPALWRIAVETADEGELPDFINSIAVD